MIEWISHLWLDCIAGLQLHGNSLENTFWRQNIKLVISLISPIIPRIEQKMASHMKGVKRATTTNEMCKVLC